MSTRGAEGFPGVGWHGRPCAPHFPDKTTAQTLLQLLKSLALRSWFLFKSCLTE